MKEVLIGVVVIALILTLACFANQPMEGTVSSVNGSFAMVNSHACMNAFPDLKVGDRVLIQDAGYEGWYIKEVLR